VTLRQLLRRGGLTVVTLLALVFGSLSQFHTGSAPAPAAAAPALVQMQTVDAYNDVCFLKAGPDQLRDVRAYLAEHPVVTMSEVSDNARVCVAEDDGSGGYVIHYYSYADGFENFDVYYAMTLRAAILAGSQEIIEDYLDPLDHTTLLQLVEIDDDGTVYRSHKKFEHSAKAGGKNLWSRNSAKDGKFKAKHHVFGKGKTTIVPINAQTRAEIGSKQPTRITSATSNATPKKVETVVPVAKKYTAPQAPAKTTDTATAVKSTSKPTTSSSSSSSGASRSAPSTPQSVVRVSTGRR